MDFRIHTRWALNHDGKIIQDAEIQIEGKQFTYVGPRDKAEPLPGAEKLEFPKGLAVPPFLNAHTHLPETLIRGICDDEALHVWLFEHVWKVEPAMQPSDAKIGALLGIAELISTGTIGFVDQYFYSDQIAEAVLETGVKAFLAPSIFDGTPYNFSFDFETSFQTNKGVFDRWHEKENRIFVGFGVHAPYTVPRDWLEKILAAAKERDTIMHIHLSETEKETEDAKKNWNCTPIEYMNDLGALKHIYAAHCVYTSQKDRKLLQENKTPVLSNVQCNLKIGSGIAPIPDYLERKIPVCLGTDGSASNNNLDMLEEVRLASYLHKGVQKSPTIISANEALALGTSNASVLFPNNSYTGKLKPGSPADLSIVDLGTINCTPVINPLSNYLYAASGQARLLTMANGQILYQDGKFKTLNIEAIIPKAQKSIEEMMERAEYIPKHLH